MSVSPLLQDEKTILKTAINRALSVYPSEEIDPISVGFAEGICQIADRVFTAAWCAVKTNSGLFLAGGVHLELPQALVSQYEHHELDEKSVEQYIEQVAPDVFQSLVEQAISKAQNHR